MPLPRVAVLDAPTNLGLKPPFPGWEPVRSAKRPKGARV